MDMALLSPNAQVSLYPWKEKPEFVAMAIRHVRMFLDAHQPPPSRGERRVWSANA
jgi:hypothetical protein